MGFFILIVAQHNVQFLGSLYLAKNAYEMALFIKNKKKMYKITEQKGFTLIEVMFAVFIVAVGLLAVAAGFLGQYSLVENIKRIVVADKQIASEMENKKYTDYQMLPESETTVTVFLSGSTPTATSVAVKIVTVSSSWTAHTYPREVTRAITFYVSEKGINY